MGADGMQCLAIIVTVFIGLYNMRENARRDRAYGVPNVDGSDCNPSNVDSLELREKWGLGGMSKQEILELGDQHPAFRYDIYYSITRFLIQFYIMIGT